MLFASETLSNVPVVIGGLLNSFKAFFKKSDWDDSQKWSHLTNRQVCWHLCVQCEEYCRIHSQKCWDKWVHFKPFWLMLPKCLPKADIPTNNICMFLFSYVLTELDIIRIFNICIFIFCKLLIFSSLYSLFLKSRRGTLVIITTTTFIWPPSKNSSWIYFIRIWTTLLCKKYS